MRWNFRFKVKTWNIYFSLAKTQSIDAIVSLVKRKKYTSDNIHVLFWDLEHCTLKQAKETLKKVQEKYELSKIVITSDFVKSYHGFCFSRVDFKTYLKILLDTDYVDWNYFYWTVRRGKARIRISDKVKRKESMKVVAVLDSEIPSEIPEKLITAKYDTGLMKRGYTINVEKI